MANGKIPHLVSIEVIDKVHLSRKCDILSLFGHDSPSTCALWAAYGEHGHKMLETPFRATLWCLTCEI
jgi:hypothetical protein